MTKLEFYKNNIKKYNEKNFISHEINYTNNISGPLQKYCYVIKDNFSMMGTITTAGSLFLRNYVSPYDSTVVKLLNEAGAKPLAKTHMDEFGMGGTGLYSAFGYVLNSYNNDCIAGGSSSGSAVATALYCCDFALGTDTGDSIRKPASFNGVIGYKPSYGLISRYGVIPYSPSLDHVGLFSRKFKIIFDVMNVIARKDNNDYSSQESNIDFSFKNIDLSKIKYVVLNEMYDGVSEDIIKLFNDTISLLPSKKKEIDFGKELIEIIPAIYKIISYSEAVSCYQSFSGMTFGEKEKGKNFEEIARSTRSKYLGKEIKRRFTIGSYCSSFNNYEEMFLKSKKIRTLINDRIKEVLNENHFVISLASSTTAPLIKNVKDGKCEDLNADNILQIANFSGYPSITIPMGKINGMPIGINITSRLNTDDYLLSFAKLFSKLINEAKND